MELCAICRRLAATDATTTPTSDVACLLLQVDKGCDPLTNGPQLHPGWGGVHHEDGEAQYIAPDQRRRLLRPNTEGKRVLQENNSIMGGLVCKSFSKPSVFVLCSLTFSLLFPLSYHDPPLHCLCPSSPHLSNCAATASYFSTVRIPVFLTQSNLLLTSLSTKLPVLPCSSIL